MRICWRLFLLVTAGLAFNPTAYSAVGRIPGQFAVSPMGSAEYTIPLWTPPGIRGIQPRLALSYDSHLGYGLMGPGWTLSGFSVIARCNPTYAQDGAPAPITLTAADGLCLDGNRLRTTGTGVYQTEIANFSQVTASGMTGNGPSYFTVQGKDGLTYEYGNTTDSKILPTGSSTPYIWALDKVTDSSGNHMTFTYYQAGGAYVPLSIQYTAPRNSTSFPYQVNFTYTTKSANDPNISTKYIAGGQIQQTQQLSTITVTNAGSTVRKYNLVYTTSAVTLRATLTSIEECGGSAGTNCLQPTAVIYQSGSAGVAAPTIAIGSGTTIGDSVKIADFDGDGRSDILFATTNGTTYQWWVQLATGSGYGAPISTGAVTAPSANVLPDDFLAEGKESFLAPSAGYWVMYRYANGAFSAAPTNVAVEPNLGAEQAATADTDGDGRPDLVTYPAPTAGCTCSIYVRRNISSGSTIAFSANTTATPFTSTYVIPTIRGNYGFPNSPIAHMDFDGDGRDDIVLQTGNPRTLITETMLSAGSTFVAASSNFGPIATTAPLNFNDDNCTDLVSAINVRISPCNGQPEILLTYNQATADSLVVVDWDGDGRSDILLASGGSLTLFSSLGSKVASGVSAGISGTGTWRALDQNGDGLTDLLLVNSTANNAIYFGLHNGSNLRADLATSFTDGYDQVFKPLYTALSDSSYVKATNHTWPEQDYTGPLYVVSSYTASDGIGGIYQITNSYYPAVTNLQGRGFEGFTSIHKYDNRNGTQEYINYSTTFPTIGMLQADRIVQPTTTKTIRVTNYFPTSLSLDANPSSLRVFPYYSAITTLSYEVGGTEDAQLITTAATNYGTPDSYGNFTNVTTTLTDNDPGSPYPGAQYTTTTTKTIVPDTGSRWCLNMPTEVDVTNTAPGVPAITRHIAYTPDVAPYCREASQVIEPGGAYSLTTVYGYDIFGNPSTQTVTGVGIASRSASIDWGTSGQFPVTITNPLGQATYNVFDPSNGMQTKETDPNGIFVSWQYDDFARKIKEIRPDLTSTTWAYNDCATAGCVNTNNRMTVYQNSLNVDGTSITFANTYLDAFDRVLVTSRPATVAGTKDRNEVQYDALGRIHQQSVPCTFSGCTPYWTVNTFDLINRISTSTRPISATNSLTQTTTYGYQGRTTTVTDPQNRVSTWITKATGSLGKTRDQNGYIIKFDHDAFGSVLSATDNAATPNTLKSATYGYGIQAFPKTSSDMDAGARTYTVDALGEVTAYTDAKGQNFSMTYDALSRPTVRTEPDLTTNWTWGATAASYNIGKLQSVSSISSAGTYSESMTYDARGRLANKTIAIPSNGSYAFDYVYDSNKGLLDTMTFPVSAPGTFRLAARYQYQWGILQQIYDGAHASTIWWKNNAQNIRGQVTQETTEDLPGDPQVVTNRAFDAVTGWQSAIQTGLTSGATLQNERYLYDLVGNVTQRQNGNALLTENFNYDNLYRISSSTLMNSTGTTTNLSLVYDGGVNVPGPGNITQRSDVANNTAWTYDATKKHAVLQAGTGAGSYSYTYDANGNASTRNGTTLNWTSYNYPSSVGTSTESATFDYGPNRQRWRMVYDSSAGIETTLYATPLFEKVIAGGATDYRHYIYAHGLPVVVISHTAAGAVTVRSLLTDHQGSISAIVTDATGAASANESFTAFGNRRSASTWSGDPTSAERNAMDGVTREGYTFQTVLGSMGLNHMNGRVQDAVTGRFLSPDPFVPDAGNTQSYNRYTYVNNNPLSRIDPSGFDGCADDLSICENTGKVISDVAGFIGDFFHGLFGGGSNLSAEEQKLKSAGLLGVTTLPTASEFLKGSLNTLSVYQDVGASYGIDPNDVRLGVTPLAADPSVANEIDGATVTASRASPGDFNFAAIGRTPTFIAIALPMKIAAGGVLGAPLLAGGVGILSFAGEAAVAGDAGSLLGQNFGKLGTVVENPGLDISGFTEHGINQTITRALSPQSLLSTVSNPSVVLQQSGGQYLFLSSEAGVVLNPLGQVITTYPSSMFGPNVLNVLGLFP